MPVTIGKIYEIGQMIEKNFYPNRKKLHPQTIEAIKGFFREVGKKLKKEGKTSVDLVRELRESQ